MKPKTARPSFASIDAYIATFPAETQKVLERMRGIIKAAAPDATEKISYQIPTFELKGNLVHFAAFQNHVGFYPGSGALATFAEELSGYELAKGTVRFPLDKPLPVKLITRIVKHRVADNLKKAEAKSSLKN